MTVRVVAESTQSTIEKWVAVIRKPAEGSGAVDVSEEDAKEETAKVPLFQELSLESFVCRAEDRRLICYSLMERQRVFLSEVRDERPEKLIVRARELSGLPLCKLFETFTEV